MSITIRKEIHCQNCLFSFEMEIQQSLNLERQPHLIQAILSDDLHKKNCPTCQQTYRVEPEFPVLDLKNKLWLAAHSAQEQINWKTLEESAAEIFELALGPTAPPEIREMGEVIKPRLTFGWPALKEKIMLTYLIPEISDVELELMKAAFIKNFPDSPISISTPRLVEVSGETLVFDWYDDETHELIEDTEAGISVEKNFAETIKSHPEDWQELRKDLDQGMYVDLGKLLKLSH